MGALAISPKCTICVKELRNSLWQNCLHQVHTCRQHTVDTAQSERNGVPSASCIFSNQCIKKKKKNYHCPPRPGFPFLRILKDFRGFCSLAADPCEDGTAFSEEGGGGITDTPSPARGKPCYLEKQGLPHTIPNCHLTCYLWISATP